MSNHYCTYFDSAFLPQGLALWRSLKANDSSAVLWVLALDETTARIVAAQDVVELKVVSLGALEKEDTELAAVKAGRSRAGYTFTLSPCWPRWLLESHPEIARITYLDADLYFFSSPAPVFQAMDAANASVLITGHRFPAWLRDYERHGRFNVGILSFRNDAAGLGCLDDWRSRCLEWCEDRLEDGKYADQKYLDDWPRRLGEQLLVLKDPGVNLAPWNVAGCSFGCHVIRDITVDGRPVILFHFARFRKLGGGWWQSGQLDYGIMPTRIRNAIYGPYVKALEKEMERLPAESIRPRSRSNREFWRTLPLRLVFGGDWYWTGQRLLNFRCGLGQFSGWVLAALRRMSGR